MTAPLCRVGYNFEHSEHLFSGRSAIPGGLSRLEATQGGSGECAESLIAQLWSSGDICLNNLTLRGYFRGFYAVPKAPLETSTPRAPSPETTNYAYDDPKLASQVRYLSAKSRAEGFVPLSACTTSSWATRCSPMSRSTSTSGTA